MTQAHLPGAPSSCEQGEARNGMPRTRPYRLAGAFRYAGAGMLALAALVSPARARATDQIWWACAPIDKLDTYAATGERFTLNNFRLREDTGFASRRPFAEFSFSAVNRSDKPLHLTAQVLAFAADQQEIVLAFSLEPPFGMVPSQTTTQMKASVNVMPGELETIRQVCLRVDA